MLGQHALETALETRLEQLDAVFVDVVRNEDVAARLHGLGETRAPSDDRLSQLRPALEVQRVEGEICSRNFVLHPRARGQTLPQPRIVGAAVGVGRDQLAVDHAPGRHTFRRLHHLRHVGRQVGQPAVLQPDVPVVVAKQDAAQPVPLDLEEVLGRAERGFGRSGLHRTHLVREALQLDRELVGVVHPPQIRGSAVTKLYDVSWFRRPASPARRAASWPAPPTAATLP